MMISTPEGIYKIKTFPAKVVYIDFMMHGGIYTEATIKRKFKGMFILLTLYVLSFCVMGPTLFLLWHIHDTSITMTQRILTSVNINGVLISYFAKFLNHYFKDAIRTVVESMDNNFHMDLHRTGQSDVPNEVINVTWYIYLSTTINVIIVLFYIFARLIGLAIMGSEHMSNIFFHLSPQPLEFVEEWYGLATAYFLAYFLSATALTALLPAVLMGFQIPCVICGTIYNHLWYLRCRMVNESGLSTQILENHDLYSQERRELETRNVAGRYHQYMRYYQKLLREIDNIRTYVEVYYSSIYFGTLLVSVPAGILIMTNEEIPLYTLLPIGFLLLPCMVSIIYLCRAGTLFEEMNAEIIMALYDSPWIYLKPTQRRDLITFMSMLQNPISFNVLKLRPVNMVLLLRFYQLNYTTINFIRMRTTV